MKTVKDILASKGVKVVSVDPEATVIQALEIMAEKNIGAALVLAKGGEVEGIFSERDFARKIILKGHDCDTTRVKEIMTKEIVYAAPETSVADCMGLMTDHHFRHLPVKSGDKVVGVISIGDVVKWLIEEQKRTIAEQAFEIGQNERKSPSAV
ncbi:MAG: putative signal transduction protein [Spirochaetes bacterium]|nr:MAG: putative signal transduction protein [Spirochaetota bacterium]